MQASKNAVGKSLLLVVAKEKLNSLLLETLNLVGLKYTEKYFKDLPKDDELLDLLEGHFAVLLLHGEGQLTTDLATAAKQANVPLIVCGKKSGQLVLQTVLGANTQCRPPVNCGVLSLDGEYVHVGTTSLSEDICRVVTDASHNLGQGDTIQVNSSNFTVLNVLDDHTFTIQCDTNIKQGTEVLLVKQSNWPEEMSSLDISDVERLDAGDIENVEVVGMIVHHLQGVLMLPGSASMSSTRHIKQVDLKKIDGKKIGLVGNTGSNLFTSLTKVLKNDCQYEILQENCESDEPKKSDISPFDLIICLGGTFDLRQKMGNKCLDQRKPFIVLSQQGRAGCMESFVPDTSISYTCVPDPVEKEFPHCVLKSFPYTGHQAVVWADTKLKTYQKKFNARNKFIKEHKDNLSELGRQLAAGTIPPGARDTQFFNLNFGLAPTWQDCVRVARTKMEKYFVHKALELTTVFPADTLLNSGAPFWSWPKLMPHPVTWTFHTKQDQEENYHHETLLLLATMFANLLGISIPADKCVDLGEVDVPKFVPKRDKSIVTDESVSKEDATGITELDLTGLCNYVESVSLPPTGQEDADRSTKESLLAHFAGLRCDMYGIPRPCANILQQVINSASEGEGSTCGHDNAAVSLQLAGQCVQAAADILSGGEGWSVWVPAFYNNQDNLILANNLPPKYTVVHEDLKTSIWDTWQVQGNTSFTIQQFIQHIQDQYKAKVCSVFLGSKIIYIPMPPWKNRVNEPLEKYLKKGPGQDFAYLTLMAEGKGEEVSLPKTKYYF